MTNAQLFFALVGVMVAQAGALKLYMDAKIDPVKKQVDFLVHYVVEHSERIAILEERTKQK
jgi:hypothetical protein